MTLYQTILGEDYRKLPPVLRAFHARPEGGGGTGHFAVTGGSRKRQRLLARLMGFPPPNTDVPVTLRVVPKGDRERWFRSFGSTTLKTEQWNEGGHLLERSGPLTFVMALSADAGGLNFHFDHSRLFGIRLPRSIELQVEAWTRDVPDGWEVQVAISWAPVGLLVRYQGILYPNEGMAETGSESTGGRR